MAEYDPRQTVPRTPPAPSAASDSNPRVLSDSAAPDAPPGTVVRTPSDVVRLEANARAQAAEGVPGYAMLGELGRGGMGVVYKARHLKLNRVVALKMMLGGEPTGRGELIRFMAEAEAVAAIKHENVVQVYDYGESAGRPFMALEFCPGGTLDRLLPTGSAARPPRDVAALVARVAHGVAAAHAMGIVHRDLKPGNVFLDAAGVPKVADFGLAKRGEGADVTTEGVGMGTPAYMAPEQARDAKFVGPQADVWALGVMLYEGLIGVRPFTGTVQEILAKAQNVDPRPPRALAPAVSYDLELICLKCLAKPPHERYPTAKELADDLDRYARGEAISVRLLGAGERLVRWVRRKPAVAAVYGFSALAAALALTAFVVFGFWREAEGAKQRLEVANGQLATEQRLTDDARREADRLRGIAEQGQAEEGRLRGIAVGAQKEVEVERAKLAVFEYGRTVQVAHQEWRDNNIAAARALLSGTRPALRGWEWHYVHRLCNSARLTLAGHNNKVMDASFTADGSRIVTASEDDTAVVWDANTGAALLTFKEVQGHLYFASASPDGSRIVTALKWGEVGDGARH